MEELDMSEPDVVHGKHFRLIFSRSALSLQVVDLSPTYRLVGFIRLSSDPLNKKTGKDLLPASF